MTSRNLTILTLLALLAAFSENSSGGPGQSPPATPNDSKDSGNSSSEINREHLRFSVLADIGGTWTPVTAPGIGFVLGLYLTSNNIVEGNYARSAATEYFGKDQLQILMNFSALRLKHFVGNSFFVEGGAGTKIFQIKQFNYLGVGSADDVRRSKYEETLTSYGTVFALGNRWQFSHFSLTGTWLELYFPMSVTSNSRDIDSGISTEDQAKLEDRTHVRTVGTDATIRFSLGWAF